MKCGLICQGTCHLDQTNPLVIWHLFVHLPRTPKEAAIPGYHKIAVFATIYSKAFCYIFPSINCSQNSWMQHIHFGLLMPLVHNCQQSTVLVLRRYICPTALFVIETTSETSPNICLIMFRPLQIFSFCQI